MSLDLQYDLVNDTPANASPVESNFNRIEQYVNQELVARDGNVSMTAQLRLVGDPVSPLDAAPKQYVDQILPVGIIMMYGGAAAPPGGRWGVCNGAELESALWPDLFAIIGRAFTPAASPAGRFNLPNLADRVPVGVGALTPAGATGGRRDGTTTPHTHDIVHNHASFNSGGQSVNHTHTFSDTTSTTSSAGTHNHGIPNNTYIETTFGGTTSNPSSGGAGGLDQHLDQGAHTHTVSVSGTTGNPSAGHVHAIDIPVLPATNSGPATGALEVADVTNANMPPYLGVQYVIRMS